MLAEAREVERTAGARDAGDNRDTRIPDGEQVWIPAIWLTELYTPTTVGGLVDGLPSVMAKARDQRPERGDIVEWLQDARRRGGGAWRMLPNVTSADAGIRMADWIVDDLPEHVASVTWGIYALTSTVTAVTALFRLKEGHAAGLQRIVDQDVSTRATITPDGSYTISDVRWLKQQAADKWREELRAGASGWLSDRLPGSFHRLRPGELPATELLVTERQLPWDEREAGPPQPRRGWTQLLDLESFDGFWQCTAFRWLRLRERRSHGWGSGPRHLLTLGALRQGLLSLSTTAGKVAREPGFALGEAMYSLHFYVVPLANRQALTALLVELDEQLAAIRDLTEQATGARSPRALDRVRRQLVTTGLESQIVANDIASFARDERHWKYEFLDFTHVLPAALATSPDLGRAVPPARERRIGWGIRLCRRTRAGGDSGQRGRQDAQEQAPAVRLASLAESLRQGQIERGTLVAESEAKVRDLINTSAQLTAAAENIRLQRRVWWLTFFSVIVAVIAAAAAVAAVRAPSSSPAPAPAARPSISHSAPGFPAP
jgi:hypothetical protein